MTHSKYLIHFAHYYYCYGYCFHSSFLPEREYMDNTQAFSVQKLWFCYFIAYTCRDAPNLLHALLWLYYQVLFPAEIVFHQDHHFPSPLGWHLRIIFIYAHYPSVVPFQSSGSTDSLPNDMCSTNNYWANINNQTMFVVLGSFQSGRRNRHVNIMPC